MYLSTDLYKVIFKVMYTVILKNIDHEEALQIGISFTYNDALKAIVKQFGNVQWSSAHKCFYTSNNRTNYNALYQFLREHDVYVDYSNFKVATSAPIVQQTKKVQTAFYNEHLAAFKSYLVGKRLSKSTIDTYMYFVSMFLNYLGSKPVKDVTEVDVRLFIEEKVLQKKYSISTHRQLISGIKHLLSLHGNQIVLNELSRPKKSQHLPVVLNQTEVIELLKVTVNLKHRCLLAMLYSCGLRVGEILELELKDIDIERMQLLVRNGKGRKDRYVGLATSVLPVLNNYTTSYRPTTYLFENTSGTKYSSSSLRAFLKRNSKRAGIKKIITPHTLRHSYATHLIENGTGIAHVQRLLGHSKPETTMLYTHIANVDLVNIENL